MKKVELKLLILMNSFVFNISYAVDVIRFPWTGYPDASKDNYYLAVLKLALKKSEAEFGPYQLVQFVTPINQSRAIKFIEHEKMVDIMWTMTSIERERQLKPIRIPLVKWGYGLSYFFNKKGRAVYI